MDSFKSLHDAKHFWVLCPFHDDTNASMVINKGGRYAGYYKCFTCGAYGSPKLFALWAGKNPSKVYFPAAKAVAPVKVDWDSIMRSSLKNIGAGLPTFCETIGISPLTATKFRVGFDVEKYEYLIPMYNPQGEICGIQRRAVDGTKRSMAHSKQGIFIARRKIYLLTKTLFICEGFSDTAVVKEMGFQAIGKYNASQRLTEDLAKHLRKFEFIVLVSDNDKVGWDGANSWNKKLKNSIIIAPYSAKYKDIRKQYTEEGFDRTKQFLERYNGKSTT
jgi:DNA primase